MAGLLSEARPLDWLRGLLAPDPGWRYGGILPVKSRTPLDPIYGAPQIMQTEFKPAIPGMAREMGNSLLNVLEAPYTGVMPTPADLLNITPMTSAPGLLAKIPAGALTSGAVRRAAAPEPAARSPLGFYSPTEQAVLNLKQKTLTPDQARASLANLGAKPEEMQWMGVDEFLAARPSVTQDELLDFVRQNRVNVEQVTYGGPDPEALVRQADELMLQGQRVQASGDLDAARVLFDQHDDLMRRAEGIEASPQGLLAPKFSEYSLPGGENYREVVLTMQKRQVPETGLPAGYEVRPLDGHPTAKYTLVGPSGVGSPVGGGTLEEAIKNANLKLSMNPPAQPSFKGGHFPDENVLAHVRMNDRVDADGKKVLFIEEIQSDWHQKGRREGYKQPPPPITPDIQLKLDRYNELEGIGNRLASSTPKELTAEWQVLKQELQPWLDTQVRRVPDAPFKKTWSDLAMKRVMQMAADEGYDRVAWTPGRMQADRYDLSQQISEIHYSGSSLKAYDHDGATVISRAGVKESDLPDLIGKEAADRLLAQKSDGTLRSLVGQDLQVGGEGMISFYDKMLPKKAQKIARRLDKDAKVGTREFDAGDEVYSITNTTSGHSIGGGYSRAEAQQLIDAHDPGHYEKVLQDGGTHKAWSIDITPAMRKTVRTGGQPLFANPAAAAAPGLLSTQQPAPPPSMIMDSRQRIPRGLLDDAA